MTTVALQYGSLTGDGLPDGRKPHVSVQIAPRLLPALAKGQFVPPEGNAFLSGGEVLAHVGSLYVTIEAATGSGSVASAEAAARALRPAPLS
jgi:hypothetical protein